MSKRCKETTYTTTHTMTRRLQPLRTRIAISEGVMVCCDKCRLSRPHERATWTSYTTKHDDLALQRTRRCSEAQARDCLSASPHASALFCSVGWVGLVLPTHSFESASPRSSSSSLPFAAATVAAALSASFFLSFLSFLCLRWNNEVDVMGQFLWG